MPRTPRPGRKRWRDGGLADDGSKSRSWVLGAAPQHSSRQGLGAAQPRRGRTVCRGLHHGAGSVRGGVGCAHQGAGIAPGAAPQCRGALGAFGAVPRWALRHGAGFAPRMGGCATTGGSVPCWGLCHGAGRWGLRHVGGCTTARGSHRALRAGVALGVRGCTTLGAAPRRVHTARGGLHHDTTMGAVPGAGGRTGSGRVSGGSPTTQGSRRALGLRHGAGIGAAPRCRDRAGHWGSIAVQGSRWALGAAPWCRDRAERRGKRHDAGVTPGSGGCATAQGSRWAADCRRWGLCQGAGVAPNVGAACATAHRSHQTMGVAPRRRGCGGRSGLLPSAGIAPGGGGCATAQGWRRALALRHGTQVAPDGGGCPRRRGRGGRRGLLPSAGVAPGDGGGATAQGWHRALGRGVAPGIRAAPQRRGCGERWGLLPSLGAAPDGGCCATAHGLRRALGLHHGAWGAAGRWGLCHGAGVVPGAGGSAAVQGWRRALGAAPRRTDRAGCWGLHHCARVTPGAGLRAWGAVPWCGCCATMAMGDAPRRRGGAERWDSAMAQGSHPASGAAARRTGRAGR